MKNKYTNILSEINNDERGVSNSVLIVDGMNCFIRSFTMINHVNSEGFHVGGLTGFLKSIGYAIKILNPTKVIIVFDGVGGSNARKNLYPEYKANRNVNRMTNYSIFSSKEEENESINNQMERLILYLKCLPVSIIGIDGLEADDIIGYLSKRFENYPKTQEVFIMSADKDFLQLVSNKTSVYSPTKKIIYTPEKILEEYGVSNDNFIHYKTLMGDKSDNIPGVPGLGPIKLLKLFPELVGNKISLDDIILKSTKNIGENKLYSSIIGFYPQLITNEKLIQLGGEFISFENKQLIKELFTNCYELNKYLFHQLYINDKLGESIPNVEQWLSIVFDYLNHFN